MIQEADQVNVGDLGASTVGLILLEQMEGWLTHQYLACPCSPSWCNLLGAT